MPNPETPEVKSPAVSESNNDPRKDVLYLREFWDRVKDEKALYLRQYSEEQKSHERINRHAQVVYEAAGIMTSPASGLATRQEKGDGHDKQINVSDVAVNLKNGRKLTLQNIVLYKNLDESGPQSEEIINGGTMVLDGDGVKLAVRFPVVPHGNHAPVNLDYSKERPARLRFLIDDKEVDVHGDIKTYTDVVETIVHAIEEVKFEPKGKAEGKSNEDVRSKLQKLRNPTAQPKNGRDKKAEEDNDKDTKKKLEQLSKQIDESR